MNEQDPERHTVRRTGTQRRADAWALTLASQGISSQIELRDDEWFVDVLGADSSRAAAVLDDYDRENASGGFDAPQSRQGSDRESGQRRAFVASVMVAASLVTMHAWIAAAGADVTVYPLGSARADRILDGEVWRAATALTLHADVFHVLANAIFGALFLGALFLHTGVGVGLAITVGSAASANFANAALRGPGYDGLGASTAVFAALGAVAGLATRDAAATRRGLWMPLLAAAAMAALFGTSERSDVMAHALGFAFGVVAGLLTAAPVRRFRTHRVVQWTAGVLTGAALIAAWGLALEVGTQ